MQLTLERVDKQVGPQTHLYPLDLSLVPGAVTVLLGATQLRLRSRGGSFELLRTIGAGQRLHVYPNFAAVARYAWLAGDKRLAQIGIKVRPNIMPGPAFFPKLQKFDTSMYLLSWGTPTFDALYTLLALLHMAAMDNDDGTGRPAS